MSFYTDFAAHYERIFPFRPATLAFLQAWLPERGRVLDLGCGSGHYAGALAAAGLESVGLDLDEAMIEAARERYPGALFAVGDMAETRAITEYADGAYCVGNVLPHLEPASLGEFLADMATVLPVGAPWIVQTVNFDRLLPLTAPHTFPTIDAGDGLVFTRRYEAIADGALRFATSLCRNSDVEFSGDATLWPFVSTDLTAIHREAGFTPVVQLGGFADEEFKPEQSPGLVQVYRRA